ncbi:MAG TPA: ATP-binding protein [Terriglobia bacterium]|nr:ATP-binding protein [Terriglobia bacterium]
MQTVSAVAAWLTAAVTLVVLSGWAFDIEVFKSVLPGRESMKANTATALLLCAVSLWLLQENKAQKATLRRAGQAAAVLAALLCLLTLAEYVFGWQLGIDELLFSDPLTAPESFPGRMTPMTAIVTLLLSAALFFLGSGVRNGTWLAEAAALVALLLSFLALLGYLYGISALYKIGAVSSMALPAAFSAAFLGMGVLAARPRAGLAAILASDTAGSVIVRRLVPAAILIPPLLTWLRMQGERLGYYDVEFGAAMIATTYVLLFTGLILWSGISIHRREQAWRRSQEEVHRLFTLSQDLLCVAGFDGYFKRLNPAWEKLLGYTLEELMAKPYVEFLHPDDRARTLAEARDLAAGQTTYAFENRYRAKDGTYRWLSWKAHSIPGEQLIYGAARDVTEQKQRAAEVHELNDMLKQRVAELDATNKELEAFTYSVSHDLRAPLRHMDGFSRILEEEYGAQLDATAQRYLRRVREGARHMGELVDDLLSLSRVGRQELRRQVTGLNSLVEEVRGELRELAEQRGVRREVEWRIGQLPFADCDPHLMKQVFANLLSNAVKYTRPRPRAVIEIGCRQQEGETVFFVRDNGVGFSMKYADKLFGVFQRLHRPEDFEGTGVGLATVQRIIHKHGGRVWAEAELDRGACFYFTLGPASVGHPESPAPAAVSMQP